MFFLKLNRSEKISLSKTENDAHLFTTLILIKFWNLSGAAMYKKILMIKILAQPVLESIYADVKQRSTRFLISHGTPPHLAVILVGEDPASVIYTRKKGKIAVSLGMTHQTLSFPSSTHPQKIKETVHQLNLDPRVHGVLIQRPLPSSFIEEEIVNWISPNKDVDAFHPIHAGRLYLGLPTLQPCTPTGIMELLKYYQINPSGKIACIIGRSSLVGKPMAALLLKADATLIHCHQKTPNLASFTRQADLLIVATGKAGLIDSHFIKAGSVVIDVGVHRNLKGELFGDVQFDEVAQKASAITPVPGGVGPMTIGILMQNTVLAAELQNPTPSDREKKNG